MKKLIYIISILHSLSTLIFINIDKGLQFHNINYL